MTDDVVSLRWSLAETKSHSIGFERLLETYYGMSVLRQVRDGAFFSPVDFGKKGE